VEALFSVSGYGNRFLEDTSATARPPATVGTNPIGGMFRNGRAAITLVKGRVRELVVGDGTADDHSCRLLVVLQVVRQYAPSPGA
jgi:hypothetical protein